MKKRLRLLQVCTGLWIEGESGGIAKFVVELSRALDQSDIEPVILALWDYGTSSESARRSRLQEEGIEVRTAAPWDSRAGILNMAWAFQGMLKILRQTPVDIIHSHSEFGDFAAPLLKRITGTAKVVRTLHNHEWRRRTYLRPVVRLLYPFLFDAEFAVGPQIKASLDGRWMARLLKKQALFLNNAINLDYFDAPVAAVADYKKDLELPADSLVIGSVGRLVEQKGYDVLLRALAEVVRGCPRVYLLLIGAGRCEKALRHLASELSVAPHVVFTGPRSDVPALLKCLDLFVSSSLWEGLPTVIMEAMAAGVPVLATDIPGTRDLIRHQFNGWLVPPGSSAALTEGILAALNEPVVRQRLRTQGRETVKAFSMKSAAARHIQVYSAISAKGPV